MPSSISSIESPRFKLSAVALFGRTMAEYLQMFALERDALKYRRVLDCASGPCSFVAEAKAEGIDVTGCDPAYGEDPDTIAARAKSDIDTCREQIRRNPGVLAYGDIDRFYGEKYAALERFVIDFRSRRGDGSYVVGSLPSLPFENRSFDLVLTANFLMVYAPIEDGGMHEGHEFDLDFHLRSIEELARIARRELRIPGMHTWSRPPERHPYAEPIGNRLDGLGWTVTLVGSDYDDGCLDAAHEGQPVLVARR